MESLGTVGFVYYGLGGFGGRRATDKVSMYTYTVYTFHLKRQISNISALYHSTLRPNVNYQIRRARKKKTKIYLGNSHVLHTLPAHFYPTLTF